MNLCVHRYAEDLPYESISPVTRSKNASCTRSSTSSSSGIASRQLKFFCLWLTSHHNSVFCLERASRPRRTVLDKARAFPASSYCCAVATLACPHDFGVFSARREAGPSEERGGGRCHPIRVCFSLWLSGIGPLSPSLEGPARIPSLSAYSNKASKPSCDIGWLR